MAVDFYFVSFASFVLLSFRSVPWAAVRRKVLQEEQGSSLPGVLGGGCVLSTEASLPGRSSFPRPGRELTIALMLTLMLILKQTLYCITAWWVAETSPLINVHINCMICLKSNICTFFFLIGRPILFYLFILAALGLRCCAQAFSRRGLLFVAVCRLLIAVAFLVVEHGL